MAACCKPHARDTMRTVPRTIAPAEINPDLTFNGLSLEGPATEVRRRFAALAAGAKETTST